MGFEYELLRDFATARGVRLNMIVNADINEAFEMLNKGDADLLALNLEVTEKRKKYAEFTIPHNQLGTVLVQRKSNQPIRKLEQLSGKTVHVRKSSTFKTKMELVSFQLAGKLQIVEDESYVDGEKLIEAVSKGDINYTIVDEDMGMVNSTYFENIDVDFKVSDPVDIAWAVRRNAPDFLAELNTWLEKVKKSAKYRILFEKYFKNPRASYFRGTSPYSSVSGNRISAYDEIIKYHADELGWDWRMLAALIYKESHFDVEAESWAGARGLMQLMPATMEHYGVSDPINPRESIAGGVRYLKYLDRYWTSRVPAASERVKFILASYNVGQGHVDDAVRLAIKYRKDPSDWNDVAYYLERKSQPLYYRDEVVRFGYCRGSEPVNYVRDILRFYNGYKLLILAY